MVTVHTVIGHVPKVNLGKGLSPDTISQFKGLSTVMVRFILVALVAIVALPHTPIAQAQTYQQLQKEAAYGEKVFKPLKNFRERAANGVLADAKKKLCAQCLLKGKLCPKCAAKRCEAAVKEAKEKLKIEKFEEAELKKLEAEAKKAELEAKLLEEEDEERNKPWDIADEENLESPSPLLQLAAASKIDQDLSPKKQDALNYLSTLGCNKDPKVEEAIIAGLQDYNGFVRQAAILAVIRSAMGIVPSHFELMKTPEEEAAELAEMMGTTLCGCGCPPEDNISRKPDGTPVATFGGRGRGCACLGKKPKEPIEVELTDETLDIPECKLSAKQMKPRRKIFQSKCRSCRGGGCDACNQIGEVAEVYQDGCGCGMLNAEPLECVACQACQYSDGCLSCCPSEAIIAELKRIAFDPDPERPNCHYEPHLDLRNLALEALNICPALAEEDEDDEEEGISETGDDEDEEAGISEEGDDAEETDLPEGDVDSIETPEPDDGMESTEDTDEDTIELLDEEARRGNSNRYQSIGYSNTVEDDDQFLKARVSKFFGSDEYEMSIAGDYLIPVGQQLFVQTNTGEAQIVEVVSSSISSARVRLIDGSRFAARTPRLSIGIIE